MQGQMFICIFARLKLAQQENMSAFEHLWGTASWVIFAGILEVYWVIRLLFGLSWDLLGPLEVVYGACGGLRGVGREV